MIIKCACGKEVEVDIGAMYSELMWANTNLSKRNDELESENTYIISNLKKGIADSATYELCDGDCGDAYNILLEVVKELLRGRK